MKKRKFVVCASLKTADAHPEEGRWERPQVEYKHLGWP